MKRIKFVLQQQPIVGQTVLDNRANNVGNVVEVRATKDHKGLPVYEVTADVLDECMEETVQILGSVGAIN